MAADHEETKKVICKYCKSVNCTEISAYSVKEISGYSLYVCRECGKLFEVEDERD